MSKFLQLDSAGGRGKSLHRQQAQNADQRQQQSRQAGPQGMVRFLHSFMPFLSVFSNSTALRFSGGLCEEDEVVSHRLGCCSGRL